MQIFCPNGYFRLSAIIIIIGSIGTKNFAITTSKHSP
jgi:hypothetical protein